MTNGTWMTAIAAFATLMASPQAYAQAVDETSTVTANVTGSTTVEWLSPPSDSVRGGMKTSDILALPKSCAANVANEGHCVVTDGHQSTPKNIGNILCLPVGITQFVIEDSCMSLLLDGQSRCRRNSNG